MIGQRPWRRGLAAAAWALAGALLTLAGAQPALTGVTLAPADTAYPDVTAGHALVFPRDYGSHPTFRTEWWYVTGWLETRGGESLGFQITFFRTRPNLETANPSAFAPRQLLIAHSAISDPKRGRLWQDQRIRRAGFGLAEASSADTDVRIDAWSLQRASGIYRARIEAEDFTLALELAETQPLLLNGAAGVSSKGPASAAASYYYSLPHLKVAGRVTRAGIADEVTGEAWFDHEWSSQYLDADARGWDWVGINLDDGGALMAFRIRRADGSAHWGGGSLRSAAGQVQHLVPDDVTFRPLRRWTSPRTGVIYPVQWQLRIGSREFELRPLLDDQENDTRLSTGAIYWEGAVRAYEKNAAAGRGYLELTGYGEPLRLR